MDLLEIRKEIDDIDEKLIPLLLDRMECSKKVAEYKVARGIPVLNEEREQQILNDVGAKCGDKGESTRLSAEVSTCVIPLCAQSKTRHCLPTASR